MSATMERSAASVPEKESPMPVEETKEEILAPDEEAEIAVKAEEGDLVEHETALSKETNPKKDAENDDDDGGDTEVESPPPPTLQEMEEDTGSIKPPPPTEPLEEEPPEPSPSKVGSGAASETPVAATCSRRQIILLFSILCLVVIVLQGVIVGLLLNDDDDEDDNGDGPDTNDLDRGEIDTELEGQPTASPTIFREGPPVRDGPSANAETMTEDLYFKPFGYLRDIPQAQQLQTIPSSSDAVEPLSLLFPITWFGSTSESNVFVTSNGQIFLGDCAFGPGPNCGTINVAFTDLVPSTGGAVYLLNTANSFGLGTDVLRPNGGHRRRRNHRRTEKAHMHGRNQTAVSTNSTFDGTRNMTIGRNRAPNSERHLQDQFPTPGILDPMYIISWEDISFFDEPSTFLNAQARFYYNGTIELCWGDASAFSFPIYAGISDPRFSVSIPVSDGSFFGPDGSAEANWPTNMCWRFDVDASESTICPEDQEYQESVACLSAIAISDTDRNNLLDQAEYVRYLNRLSGEAYEGYEFEDLPDSLIFSFNNFARTNSAVINITGSRPGQIPTTSQTFTLEVLFLEALCCSTAIALRNAGVISAAPTSTPSPVAIAPTNPSNTNADATGTCRSTSGGCASSYELMLRISRLMQPGDTLAICGDIELIEAFEVDIEGITICCEDSSRCSLQSTGDDRVLLVSAPDVTLRGLVFDGGRVENSDGGNVLVNAPGHIEISSCVFLDGNAVYGGNLHVRNANSVRISNTIFEFGTADEGGGVAIENTPNVTIEESFFESNRCGGHGGGLFVYSSASFRSAFHAVSLSMNYFTSNGANIGGGFAVRNLGDNLRLVVEDNFFGDNGGADEGGAGAIFQNTTLFGLILNNLGERNTAVNGACSDFYFRPFPNSDSGSACHSVDEYISYLPGTPTTGAPTFAPAPTSSPPLSVPTLPPTTASCVGSLETCASNFDEILRYNSILDEGDTLAICGTILMFEPLVVTQARVTICCEDSSRCILQSPGEDRNLVVNSPGVTLRGIVFERGASEMGNGGNVLVDSPGDLRISHCAFIGGNAVHGGNLFVQNAPNIYITNSRFEIGTAERGGGLAVQNCPNVIINDSFFDRNRCGGEGGGLFVSASDDDRNEDYTVYLSMNRFQSNGANEGGGFFIDEAGETFELTVFDSYFEENLAATGGGAASISQTSGLIAVFRGNFGSDNIGGDVCSDVLFRSGSGFDSDCRPVDESIVYTPTENGASSAPAPTPQNTFPTITRPTTMAPSPANFPTLPPIIMPPSSASCIPTVGICASIFPEIMRFNGALFPGDTLAICGDILVVEPILITVPGVTICCQDSSRCSLEAADDQIFIVSAPNVTLQGLDFSGGSSAVANGGNVLIDSPGYFSVLNCLFQGGRAPFGGNLYISGATEAYVAYSIFEGGSAEGGGAIAFENTANVTIEGSYFYNNRCGDRGGGILVIRTDDDSVEDPDPDPVYHVSISSTSFESNRADSGAGFAIVDPPNALRLVVEENYFADNGAAQRGGAGIIVHNSSILALFTGNEGQDNSGIDSECGDFFFDRSPKDPSFPPRCVLVSEDTIILPIVLP